MTKFLITGATGAIGSALVRLLAAEGEKVCAFVRNEEKFKRLLPDVSAEVITGNALNSDDVRQAVEDVEVIFHCVNFPITQFERNLEAAKVLIGAASEGKPHIVFPGNTWVFGKPARTPISPETPFNPPSPIARIKARVDELLMGSGLPVTVVHLPDFYGSGVVNPLVRPLFENALAGKDVTFPAPVDVPHEFIYIDDAARALIAVAGQEACFGKRYTVGGVEPITVRRFVELIYRAAGTKGRVRGCRLGCCVWPGYSTPRHGPLPGSCTSSPGTPRWTARPSGRTRALRLKWATKRASGKRSPGSTRSKKEQKGEGAGHL